MSGTLVIALGILGIFCIILVILVITRPSEPDAVTREVIEQGLTGPVALPPAHARLDAPNRADRDDENSP